MIPQSMLQNLLPLLRGTSDLQVETQAFSSSVWHVYISEESVFQFLYLVNLFI